MSGNASHKSTAEKPNTNRNSNIDVTPEDVPTEVDFSRDDHPETVMNPATLERPSDHSHQSEESAS